MESIFLFFFCVFFFISLQTQNDTHAHRLYVVCGYFFPLSLFISFASLYLWFEIFIKRLFCWFANDDNRNDDDDINRDVCYVLFKSVCCIIIIIIGYYFYGIAIFYRHKHTYTHSNSGEHKTHTETKFLIMLSGSFVELSLSIEEKL